MIHLVYLLLLLLNLNKGVEITDTSITNGELLLLAKKAEKELLEELREAKFSQDNLYMYLILKGVREPKTVLKQAILETGYFKSRAFTEGNNLFGMHLPKKRPTTAIGYIIADKSRKVAKFNSWQDSVEDMILYQNYYNKIGYDLSNYEKFLVDAGYCELGGGYLELLKGIKIN